MSLKLVPQNASATEIALPSAVPSLTDWHTWASLLSALAAIATVVFHHDFSSYVPLAATLVAGALNVTLMVTKHSYAKALVTANATVAQAASLAPSGTVANDLEAAAKVAAAVGNVQTALAGLAPSWTQVAQNNPSSPQATPAAS